MGLYQLQLGQNVGAGALTGAIGGAMGRFGANQWLRSSAIRSCNPAASAVASRPQSLAVSTTPSLNQPVFSQAASDAVAEPATAFQASGNF